MDPARRVVKSQISGACKCWILTFLLCHYLGLDWLNEEVYQDQKGFFGWLLKETAELIPNTDPAYPPAFKKNPLFQSFATLPLSPFISEQPSTHPQQQTQGFPMNEIASHKGSCEVVCCRAADKLLKFCHR